jgi:hypothetical protein
MQQKTRGCFGLGFEALDYGGRGPWGIGSPRRPFNMAALTRRSLGPPSVLERAGGPWALAPSSPYCNPALGIGIPLRKNRWGFVNSCRLIRARSLTPTPLTRGQKGGYLEAEMGVGGMGGVYTSPQGPPYLRPKLVGGMTVWQ